MIKVIDCAGTSAMDALQKVLRLPAVHSKRFLTSKVDRCVTGNVLLASCALVFYKKPCSYDAHWLRGKNIAARSGLAINSIDV